MMQTLTSLKAEQPASTTAEQHMPQDRKDHSEEFSLQSKTSFHKELEKPLPFSERLFYILIATAW